MAMGGSIIVRNLPKAHTVQYGTFPKMEILVQSLQTSCKSSILYFLFHNILLLGELFGVWCLAFGVYKQDLTVWWVWGVSAVMGFCGFWCPKPKWLGIFEQCWPQIYASFVQIS